MTRNIFKIIASLICTIALGSTAAQATTWAASGNGTVNTVQDGSSGTAQASYNLTGNSVYSTQTWAFLTTAAQSGTYTYDWTYTGFHAYFQTTAFLNSVVNASPTSLINAGPANCCSAPSAGFTYTGTSIFNVQAGDTYGFTFGGKNGDSNQTLSGVLTLAAVPEPSTYAMLLAGLGLLGFTSFRKNGAKA